MIARVKSASMAFCDEWSSSPMRIASAKSAFIGKPPSARRTAASGGKSASRSQARFAAISGV